MKISFKGKLWIVLFCLGDGYINQRPLPFVPVTTVLDGSKMTNTLSEGICRVSHLPGKCLRSKCQSLPTYRYVYRIGVICKISLFSFPLKTAFFIASKTVSTLSWRNLKRQLYFYGCLPSTLIQHENGAFQKTLFKLENWKLKTPAFRFRADGKHVKLKSELF